MASSDLVVIGASGRVGRLLRQVWPAEGPQPLWLSRQPFDGMQLWHPDMPLSSAQAVLVLSGVTRGTEAELAQNEVIAARIGRAIAASGARAAFFASTMAVYGRTSPEGAVEGDAGIDPRPYGLAKLRAEEAFLSALPKGQGTVLRLGNLVGGDLLGDLVAAGQSITLDRFATGAGPIRSYLGPRHLARVVSALAGQVDLPPVLNVAAAKPLDMAEILVAAEIPFAWQSAPETALPVAHMSCDLLARYVPSEPQDCDPAALAADWKKAMHA